MRHMGNGLHRQWGHGGAMGAWGGQWGTRVCGKRVCSTWAMGHMGNQYGVQWVWGTWAMVHIGDGAHGQWGTWVMGYISIIKQEQDLEI